MNIIGRVGAVKDTLAFEGCPAFGSAG